MELNTWARTLLNERRYAVFGTADADGSIHLTPVWFLYRDERFFVAAPSASRKARNAVERPHATFVIDVRQPGSERWVSGNGPVEIIHGDESRAINDAIHARYLTPDAIADPRIGPGFAMADDSTLCVRPSRWRFWSASDVDAQYFGGALCANPQKWFLPID